jgi:hypothetical protein
MTEGTPTLAEQLKADMEELRAPVESHLRAIRARLEENKKESYELRGMLRTYEALMRGLNGEVVVPGPKPGTGGRPKRQAERRFSDEKIQASIEWLQENREWLNEGQGFSVPSLLERSETLRQSPLPNGQSQLAKMLAQLHEREILRISEWGGYRGSQKFYKVI